MQIKQLTVGINTGKLLECRDFYVTHFGFTVDYQGEGYLQIASPDKQFLLAFVQPNHPNLPAGEVPAFQGEGVWLAFEVADVDAEYDRLGKVLPIHTAIRDEVWGERHFVVRDPSGASVNIMTMKH
jgi:catechol 2,3-dioxygenase-like lactoylglutathione lyase family enzyme